MTVDINSKPIVVYHGSCMDGFTAAWTCWLLNPDWEYYPAVHGDPPPDFTGREVYILDFSYKRPVMEEILKQAIHVTVIDHHKTAWQELSPFTDGTYGTVYDNQLEIYFNMKHSGAALAWSFFHAGKKTPKLVELVEDYDLWTFKHAGTKAANAYYSSFDYSFEKWNEFLDQTEDPTFFGAVVAQGNSILRYNLKMTQELVKKTKVPANIGGHDVLMANLPFMYANEGCRMLMTDGKPFGASYYVWKNGYSFSLRSEENGIDVSEIAQMYPGGGGHRSSAGFTVPNLEALDIRKGNNEHSTIAIELGTDRS